MQAYVQSTGQQQATAPIIMQSSAPTLGAHKCALRLRQGRRSGAVRHGASQRRTMVVAALPAANPYAEELRKTAGPCTPPEPQGATQLLAVLNTHLIRVPSSNEHGCQWHRWDSLNGYIATRGKGILASDESNATTGKRLAAIDLDNTDDNRRDWRELLYTAPGLGKHISGAIMFEETLYQSSAAGTPFVDILREQGIVPGIKVDTGLQVLPGTDGETSTQGLDNLGSRCAEYYKQGARFAKWRAVLKVGNGCPSTMAILENAHGLARYAQIAQENGLVPIVEPEVTLGPGDYSIEETAYWSERTYSHVVRLLNEYNVDLSGILLKPNMCLPGLDAPSASPEDVAKYTVRAMLRTIPGAVPGIHFLSGGMSAEESTLNLQALQLGVYFCAQPAGFAGQSGGPGCDVNHPLCQDACPDAPWSLTFSYGRALQDTTLKTWKGKPENKDAAQEILVKLATANGQAQLGQYSGPHPAPGKDRILQALRLGGSGKA